MKDKENVETKGQGPDVSKVDLSSIQVPQIKEWLKSDVQRCISLFTALLDNDVILDELAEVFYARMHRAQAIKDKEGKL